MGNVKGNALGKLKSCVANRHGDAGMERWTAELGPEDAAMLRGLILPNSWYPVRLWNTLASGELDDSTKGAFRFMQYGTGSPAMIWGLRAALKFANTLGIDRIARISVGIVLIALAVLGPLLEGLFWIALIALALYGGYMLFRSNKKGTPPTTY